MPNINGLSSSQATPITVYLATPQTFQHSVEWLFLFIFVAIYKLLRFWSKTNDSKSDYCVSSDKHFRISGLSKGSIYLRLGRIIGVKSQFQYPYMANMNRLPPSWPTPITVYVGTPQTFKILLSSYFCLSFYLFTNYSGFGYSSSDLCQFQVVIEDIAFQLPGQFRKVFQKLWPLKRVH